MTYQTQDFNRLLGTAGFSDTLLTNHFKLYAGYVANTNTLLDTLAQLAKEGKTGTPAFAELTRRLGWEFNGMRLHELYFGNMHKEKRALAQGSALTTQLESAFGSVNAWRDLFQSIGKLRGIGWVVLAYDGVGDRLLNVWVNEHDVGHLAGATPLVVMDVFEHAFVTDYGLNRADYINSFMNAIDWTVVSERFSCATAGVKK